MPTTDLLFPQPATLTTRPTPPGVESVFLDTSGRPLALVVDDDRMMRMASGALIDALGYDCVEAPHGHAALDHYRQKPGQIAFVVLDVGMAGMSGVEVLRELVTLDPEVRVILCTGHPRECLDRDIFQLGAVEYLWKPFTREEMYAAVERVTAAAPESNLSGR